MPAISVLMPCYNAAATLDEALQSLVDQDMDDFEIVAVDDGSEDHSAVLLEAWARRDPRIRVISQPHRGIIPALNRGLAACRAPLVARMDADDRSHPTRLSRQAAYLGDHPEIGVVSCQVAGFPASLVREGFRIYMDWLNGLLVDADIRREIFVESPLPHPSVMVRRGLLEQIGGYQENGWAEDYDLWLRMYLSGVRFGKIPAVLLDWREHPTRLTRADSRYSLENFIRAKAHYLMDGPLAGRDAVIIWGAGMMGRRISKHLIRNGASVEVFVDIDPRKIGRTRRGRPVIAPGDLPDWWSRSQAPVLLAAVGARGARQLIRQQLQALQLREGQDWWGVA
jgi:glycosyltransferase involved in cell wall biosynthesis